MVSMADTSILWLGFTSDIHATSANCNHCNHMTPSQAALPPTPPIIAAFPFQRICADYFQYQEMNYVSCYHGPILQLAYS